MKEKKNVILIVVDQMRYDCMGINGNNIISTPNLKSGFIGTGSAVGAGGPLCAGSAALDRQALTGPCEGTARAAARGRSAGWRPA